MKTSAPIGARMPQMPTPVEVMKPPSGIIDTFGASRMSRSSTCRNSAKSRVRAKTAIAPSEMAKYTNANTPDGAPSAR